MKEKWEKPIIEINNLSEAKEEGGEADDGDIGAGISFRNSFLINLKIFYITLFIFFKSFVLSQTDILWLKQITGSSGSTVDVVDLAVDNNGDLLVLANFKGTLIYDIYTLSSFNNSQDILVAKFNSKGEFQWWFNIGGSLSESAWSIKISYNDSSFLVSGSFASTDCNFNGMYLSTEGENDLFIAKFNLSNGQVIWAYNVAYGIYNQLGGVLEITPDNNLLFLGKYLYSVKFKPGTDSLKSTSDSYQQFIAKFDSSANLIWAINVECSDNNTFIRSIVSDMDNYYFNGQFSGDVSFSFFNTTLSLSSLDGRDGIVFKTDKDGNLIWHRIIKGTDQEFITKSTIDTINGKIYLIGFYRSPNLEIDSTNTEISQKSYTNFGNEDILVLCYDTSGTLQWANNYGASTNDRPEYIHYKEGKFVVVGKYYEQIKFGSFVLTNQNPLTSNAFIVKLDPINGEPFYAEKLEGSNNDVFEAGKIYLGYKDYYSGTLNSESFTFLNRTFDNIPAQNVILITKVGQIELNFNVINVSCYNGNDGSIDLTVLGDIEPPIFYNWEGPNGYSSSNEDINNLTAGWYKLTVSDSYGAYKVDSVYVSQPDPLQLSYVVIEESCLGGDGSIDLNVLGGTEPYSFVWNNGETTEDLYNLVSGEYSVTVTDSLNCTVSDTIEVGYGGIVATYIITNANCEGVGGSIDLTVNGGTPPYSFVWSNLETTEDIYNLTPGTYSVTITDSENCTFILEDLIVEKADSIQVSYVVEIADCLDSGGAIDLSVTGGTPPYSFIWSNGANTEDIDNIQSGTYSVTISDSQGCKLIIEGIEVEKALPPTLSYIVTNTDCYGENGAIDLIVNGGNPPFTFLWNTGATTEDIDSLTPGTYTVRVNDAKNCLVILSNIQVDINTPMSISYIVEKANCLGYGGAIDIIVYGGNSPYSYLWNTGDTTQDLINIPHGTYSITVTDASGCISISNNIVVPIATEPSVTYLVNHPNCSNNNGSIELIISGGNPPFTFLWNTGATTKDIYNLSPGAYSVTISDSKNCVVALSDIIINNYEEINISYIINNPSCQLQNDGSIDVIVYGGNPPYTYLWSNDSTTQDLNNVGIGTYTLTVFDASECSKSISINLNYDYPIANLINLTGSEICYGNNAQLYVETNNGINFIWVYEDTINNQIQTNYGPNFYFANKPGNYYVIVKNADSCSTMSNKVNINVSEVNLTLTTSDSIICESGEVTIFAEGGIEYYWSTGDTTSTITKEILQVTTFYVTAYNELGCSKTSFITINVSNNPTITAIVQDETCIPNSGGIDITVQGGTPPYSFLWSNGATSEDLSNLSPGDYSLTVTTNDGCKSTFSTTINPYQPLEAHLNTNYLVLLCENSNNGQAYVITNYGLPPYTYLWSSGVTTPYNNNLSVGTHYVTVTDICGNSAVDSITVSFLPPLNVVIDKVINPTCQNSNDGSILLSVLTGVQPYNFEWSHTDTLNDNIATNLQAGTYTITISDVCKDTVITVHLNNPQQLSVSTSKISNTTCLLTNNGSAIVVINNEVPPISILWSNGETNLVADSLPYGYNYVTVTDACMSVIDTIFIDTEPSLSVNSIITQDATCQNMKDGKALIIFNNTGPSPLSINWSGSNSTEYFANDLPVGWNYVSITDGCGITYIDSFYIGYSTPLQVHITDVVHTKCIADSTGSVAVVPLFGVPPYKYLWSNGSTDSLISNITPGIYYVTVFDYCGYVVESVEIKATSKLIATYYSKNVSCYNSNDGLIEIKVKEGEPPFFYYWENNISSTNFAINLAQGNYKVTVADRCNNLQSFSIDILQPDSIRVSFLTQASTFENSLDGNIITTIVGGTPPYYYLWSNGSNTKDLYNVSSGTYTLTITDSNNCQEKLSVYLDYKQQFIEIYNTFTPNNDGLNDYWYIKNIDKYPDCKVQVFDIYGNLVFESIGYENPWDGKKDGITLPAGTYYYVIELNTENKIYTGSLTILY